MKTGLIFRPRANAKSGSILSGLLFGRGRLRNQFGFLSAQYGFSYRWQIGSFFGLDRRKNKRDVAVFSMRASRADQDTRSHRTGRWGLALTHKELTMTTELEANAVDMQAQTAQMEQELLSLAPSLNGADISETARQAFARLDQMMERWHIKADLLQRQMLSPVVRQQFSNMLPGRRLSPAFFMGPQPRLNLLQQKAHQTPLAAQMNRRSPLRQDKPAAAPATPPTLAAAHAAKAALQQRLQAMHTHTEQLSANLHHQSQNTQQRVLRRHANLMKPTLKPSLHLPDDTDNS